MKDNSKIKKAIAYIINYFQEHYSIENLGSVKLNKILWFCEENFIYKYNKPFLNLTFVKKEMGPVPNNIKDILDEMVEEKSIFIWETDKQYNNGRFKRQFVCIETPNVNDFTREELITLDLFINKFAKEKANNLSELSHDEQYNNTKMGDVLYPEMVLLNKINFETPKH